MGYLLSHIHPTNHIHPIFQTTLNKTLYRALTRWGYTNELNFVTIFRVIYGYFALKLAGALWIIWVKIIGSSLIFYFVAIDNWRKKHAESYTRLGHSPASNEVISCFNPTRTTITLYICLRTCVNNRFILNYRQKLPLQNHGFTKRTDNTKRNYVKFKQLAEL